MEWLDMKDAPTGPYVLISIRWADVPVVARKVDSGQWYSSTDHIEVSGNARASDDFGLDEIEGWMQLPKPKWKVDQEGGE